MSNNVHALHRRAVLTGAGAAAAALAASTVRAEATDLSLVEIETLIARHAEAWQVDEDAWNACPENPAPLPKVQVGKILRGRDSDGNELSDPIWAYDEDDIERITFSHLDIMVSMNGRTPEGEARIRRQPGIWWRPTATSADASIAPGLI